MSSRALTNRLGGQDLAAARPFVNYFLHSPTFEAPIVKAISLGTK